MQIDLEAIAVDQATIKDRKGKVWPVDPEMTAGEALLFMNPQRMSALSGADVLEKLGGIVSRGMVRSNPEMTPEKVLDTFTPTELGYVVARFLGLTGLAASLMKPVAPARSKTTKPSARRR